MTNEKYEYRYKYLIYFVIFYFTMLAASYPVAYKMVLFYGLVETGAIFLFPFSYTAIDIISEIYGYKVSKQLVWASIVCSFIFCVAIELIISMRSPGFWHEQKPYSLVLGHILKIYFAMSVANLVGTLINVKIIVKWRTLVAGRYFWLRSIGSSGIGELFFSVIAGLISFVGVEPANKIFWLMLNGYIFKLAYACVASMPATLIVRWLKKHEVNTNTQYYMNPFSNNGSH